MRYLLLQVSSLLPAVPRPLPAIALLIGLGCLLIGIGRPVLRRLTARYTVSAQEQTVILLLLITGLVTAAVPVFVRFDLFWVYALYLFVAGRALEGAITLRVFRKVIDWWARQSDGLEGLLQGFRDRMARVALSGIVALTMFGALGWTLLTTPSPHGLWTALQIFTLGTFTVVLVGLIYDTRYIIGHVSVPVAVGIVLSIGGAELYNFRPVYGLLTIPTPFLQNPTGEFAVQLLGAVGFLVGIGLALYHLRQKLAHHRHVGDGRF